MAARLFTLDAVGANLEVNKSLKIVSAASKKKNQKKKVERVKVQDYIWKALAEFQPEKDEDIDDAGVAQWQTVDRSNSIVEYRYDEKSKLIILFMPDIYAGTLMLVLSLLP